MVLMGVLVNAGAVLIGGLLGLLFQKGIPEKVNALLMQGLGLCVLYVGINGSLAGENTIIAIISIVIGGIIGQLCSFNDRLTNLGYILQAKFQKENSKSTFAEGFITCTLFICVGAMAIIGSLQSGLTGNHETLYAKALLDGVTAIVMASTMGIGVSFAAVSVLLYESVLTLSAGAISGLLTMPVVNEMTCVGSLLIIGIGLNLLKVTDIKVANFLAAPFLPILWGLFF